MTKNNTHEFTKCSPDGLPTVFIDLHATRICVIETTRTKEGKKGYKVTLNSGGWMTSTTKKRMNEAADEFCEGNFYVKQKAHLWTIKVYTTHKAGDLSTPVQGGGFFDESEEIPDPDQPHRFWKEIPFVDGMTFEIET